MKRYESPAMMITVPLSSDDYKLMCIYSYTKTENIYSLMLMLKRNDIDDLYYIDTQPIKSTKENIRKDICILIERMELVHFFDKYIDQHTYYLKCFDFGNDYYETEELKKERSRFTRN